MRSLRLALSMLSNAYRRGAKLAGLHRSPARGVVLTYHAVQGVELSRFLEQMQCLVRHCEPVFADDINRTHHRPCVAVTFDDAFAHVFDRVLPQLAELRIPATIFVPTAYLGSPAAWLSAERPKVVSRATLSKLNHELVRIGSHSVNHARLASVPPAQLMRELVESKQTLEEITGRDVTMLALPYSSHTEAVLDAARCAGYRAVFANVPINPSAGRSSLLVGRVNVSPGDWPMEFRLKIDGSYDWMTAALPAKRALLRLFGASPNL